MQGCIRLAFLKNRYIPIFSGGYLFTPNTSLATDGADPVPLSISNLAMRLLPPLKRLGLLQMAQAQRAVQLHAV